MDDALATVARLFERAKIPYVVIGGHAVNVWLEPRFTADVDVTVQASTGDTDRLKRILAFEGYTVAREHGADLPSGPDFVRFRSRDGLVTLEVQAAKTEFQREAVRRALVVDDSLRVATAEDLIVFKLIANRPKDRLDLHGLIRLPHLDWPHVERWAGEWGVLDELRQLRGGVC
jgi:hypothetical protein